MRREKALIRSNPPDSGFRGRDRTVEPSPDESRYEYRVWPRISHPAAAFLNQNWRHVAAERRTDIYLLQAACDQILIKLRGGTRIEVKRLHQCVGSIEQWSMPLSSGFPLNAPARNMLADALALRRPLPESSGLTPAHLLASLDRSVVPIAVRKSRLLFGSTTCQAEICRVGVDDRKATTIALEASDIPKIAWAMEDLKLGSLPNRSYGDVLKDLRNHPPGRRRLFSAGRAARFDRRNDA